MHAIGSITRQGWFALGSAITFFTLALTAPDDVAAVDESLLLSAGLASAALLWFVGILASAIRRREGADGTFAVVALASGILVVAFAGVGAALRVVPSLGISEDLGPSATAGSAAFVEVANNELLHIATFWRGSLMASVGVVMIRSAGSARWFGWLSAALAVLAFLGGLSFVPSPVAPAATTVGYGSFIAFHFWVLMCGIVLAAWSRGTSPSEASSLERAEPDRRAADPALSH